MAVLKRATKKLADAGHPNLQVRKGMYGYYCIDKALKRQSWPAVRETAQQVVDDVILHGVRPEAVEKGGAA